MGLSDIGLHEGVLEGRVASIPLPDQVSEEWCLPISDDFAVDFPPGNDRSLLLYDQMGQVCPISNNYDQKCPREDADKKLDREELPCVTMPEFAFHSFSFFYNVIL